MCDSEVSYWCFFEVLASRIKNIKIGRIGELGRLCVDFMSKDELCYAFELYLTTWSSISFDIFELFASGMDGVKTERSK